MKAEMHVRHRYTDDVVAYFKARPKVWIEAHELAKIGGFCAWRSRVSEARKIIESEGGRVENRLNRVRPQLERDTSGQPARLLLSGRVISEYRYLPYVPLARDARERIAQKSLF